MAGLVRGIAPINPVTATLLAAGKSLVTRKKKDSLPWPISAEARRKLQLLSVPLLARLESTLTTQQVGVESYFVREMLHHLLG